MAIQVRRGLEKDFDPSKALPGEWLVSTDTRYVRMCVAPGIVLRMATYESFEEDKQYIESVLEEVQDIQSAIELIQTRVNNTAIVVENYSVQSANYAEQSKRYAENSANYAEDAYDEAERAKMYANNAQAAANVKIATQKEAGLMRGGENYVDESGALILTRTTTDRTLLHSHDGGLRINSISGESVQKSTTGAQLFDIDNPTRPGEILTLSGTFEANAGFNSYRIELNDAVTISYEKGSQFDGLRYGLEVDGVVTRYTLQQTLLTIPKGNAEALWISLSMTTNAQNNFMLNAGNTALPYEPYTGGKPSPSTEYPQKIDSVVANEIKVRGAQLFDVNDSEIKKGLFVQQDGVTNTSSVSNTSGYVFVENLQSITVNGKNDGNYRNYCWYDANKNVIPQAISSKAFPYTLEVPTGASYFRFSYVKDTENEVMVNVGVEALPWRAYTEKSIILSTPITLHGRGETKDRIVKKDGVWGVERNILVSGIIQNRVSSNEYGYTFYGSAEDYYRPFESVGKHDELLCTHLICLNRLVWNPTDIHYPCMASGVPEYGKRTNANIFFPKEYGIDTVDKLIQWGNDNGVLIYGKTATPTFEPLPTVDQIALHSLVTYDDVTHIITDSVVEPVIEVDYGTSRVGAEGILYANEVEILDPEKTAYEELKTEIAILITDISELRTEIATLQSKNNIASYSEFDQIPGYTSNMTLLQTLGVMPNESILQVGDYFGSYPNLGLPDFLRSSIGILTLKNTKTCIAAYFHDVETNDYYVSKDAINWKLLNSSELTAIAE